MMLQDRLFGAISFKQGIYYEVEHDKTFTTTAWILVIITAFLSQLGNFAQSQIVNWIAGAIGATVAEILGFAVGAFLIFWIGKNFFNAEVTFNEIVRTLGLAHIWRVIGFVGVITAIVPGLECILAPVIILATLLGLAAWFFAAKEALDLDIVQTLITVILGFLGFAIVVQLLSAVLAVLGFGSALL
jgi:hypothetical protein